jgi:hypothetical protein
MRRTKLDRTFICFEDFFSSSNLCILTVTPLVLRPKQTAKPHHEHHVYVLEHVGK